MFIKVLDSLKFSILFIGFIVGLLSFQVSEAATATNTEAFVHFQDGDIIFHKSQSSQSSAIAEATGSSWSHVGIIVKNGNDTFVAEAIQPVTITSLRGFIARGKNSEFKVYRFKHYNNKTMKLKLYSTLRTYYGKNYDIYFEFGNDRIYCSELVYKVFKAVTGQEVGRPQKMKELNLSGPHVQKLIQDRLTDIGKQLDPNELIITPVNQMYEVDMDLVFSSHQ